MIRSKAIKPGDPAPVYVTAKSFSILSGLPLKYVLQLCHTKGFPAEFRKTYYLIHYEQALAFIADKIDQEFTCDGYSKSYMRLMTPQTAEEARRMILAE